MSASVLEAREKALRLMEDGHLAFRSCHECNSAHEHFTLDEDCVILCFGCGRYWLGSWDITEYDEDVPE